MKKQRKKNERRTNEERKKKERRKKGERKEKGEVAPVVMLPASIFFARVYLHEAAMKMFRVSNSRLKYFRQRDFSPCPPTLPFTT
jgi:hypothetical protein